MTRTIVSIRAEHLGHIEMSPAEFALLIQCAIVGIDGYDDNGDADSSALADRVFNIINDIEDLT